MLVCNLLGLDLALAPASFKLVGLPHHYNILDEFIWLTVVLKGRHSILLQSLDGRGIKCIGN